MAPCTVINDPIVMSSRLVCTNGSTGSLSVFEGSVDCTGTPVVRPLAYAIGCTPSQTAPGPLNPFGALEMHETSSCQRGAYSPPPAPAGAHARSTSFRNNGSTTCESSLAMLADGILPTINSCFSDGTTSAMCVSVETRRVRRRCDSSHAVPPLPASTPPPTAECRARTRRAS